MLRAMVRRDDDRRFRGADARVLWVLWLTYGTYYFCRSNLAVAVPGLQHELHFTKAEIGSILAAFKLTYGIGQLLNGQLAQRVSARLLLALGLLGSATFTIVFGLSTGLYTLIYVWAINGYFQSLGWSPTMRVAATWFEPARRGRAIAIIGTGYQLAGALTFVVAGWAADRFGWRGALYVPAGVLIASAIHLLLVLEEKPAASAGPRTHHQPTPQRWLSTIGQTLANPRLWLLAVGLGLINACRFGFLDWGVAHLSEVQPSGIGISALKYSVLPLGGIVGTLLAGWATDRFFGGRRIPVIVGMLVLLCALVFAYDALVRTQLVASIATLAVIGALIFGPQVLLVGTAPVDLARVGTEAAAVGFVNFFGYLGAAAGDRITGELVHVYDWHAALWFWAGCALGAALVVAPLWWATAYRRDA